MTGAALSFTAGVLLLQQQAALPPVAWLATLPLCAAFAWWNAGLPSAQVGDAPLPAPPRAWRAILMLGTSFAVGFLWAAGLAHLRLAERLAPELEGRDLEVVGTIASLPATAERGVRFAFDLEGAAAGLPRRVLLSWFRSPYAEEASAPLEGAVHPGERWLFTVRLRQPHGHLNPHGFDYEAWLTERGIGATGYVRSRGVQRLLGRRDSLADRIEQLREAVRDRFRTVLGESPSAGILVALAIGEQRAIANEEWRLFSRTGVTHLMSISGLHVTLISGLCAWLVQAFWRRAPRLALALAARKAGAAAAIAAALGYTLLAGFAVPAQRTFYMVTVVALALWSGRIASPWRTLALALAVVAFLDPWAVLQPGFWLSFGAVALIFYVSAGWTAREPRTRQWLRVQWAITAGLAPAALFLFAQVSVVGPLANALAIPLVSAVITPLALLAALLPVDALLQLVEWLTQALLQYLDWCAQLPAAAWQQHAPPLWATLLALAGAAWLLLPSGFPSRALGAALMLPAFALPAPTPQRGEAWITTLDVGQGLAVVVRTAHHALLYDAGPAFGADSDSGERIVAPYLQAVGVERIDALVLTHNDADHTGGAWSVLAAIDVARVLHSLPETHAALALAATTQRCVRGMAWEWDGVRFEVLHPARADAARRRNDESCVLRIAAAGGSMLLTGDIERAAEAEVARAGLARAEVLLVPHHGSRTSSSAEFLAAAQPRHAIAAVGYRSRFGHPHPEVLGRYDAAGIALRRTDRDGALTVRLGTGGAAALEAERARRARYWHVPPPGA